MQAWHSFTRRVVPGKQPPVCSEVDCCPVIIQHPSVAFSSLGIAAIWIIYPQHAWQGRSIIHRQLLSKRAVTASWSSCDAQAACPYAGSLLKVWATSGDGKKISWPSLRISENKQVSLGRIFLTLNGAIATKYTTNLYVAPGKKIHVPWSPPLWGMFHLQKVCSGLFLQRGSEPQNICNMAATKSATAIKARQRVKEGTIKGWQGRQIQGRLQGASCKQESAHEEPGLKISDKG